MVAIQEIGGINYPTAEQLFTEARRLAREERNKATEFRFSKRYCSCGWDWFSSDFSQEFPFDGYVSITTAAYGGVYAYHKDAYWTRPNRFSVSYYNNRINPVFNNVFSLRLRFRLCEDTPLACGRKPPRTLSVILEKLSLSSARIEMTSLEKSHNEHSA